MQVTTFLTAGAALLLTYYPCGGFAAAAAPALAPLSAAQVTEKNASARGGLAAWRALGAVTWKGKMTAGGATYATSTADGKLQFKHREEAQLPFALDFKRPAKSRLELEFNGQTAVQVYDGTAGWKYRPYLGRTNWDPYTADDLQQSAGEPGIDGLLLDAAAKGSIVESAGSDKVDGHDAYKLKVKLKNGSVRYVWVDGQSFLDVKVEGVPRRIDGKLRVVEIFQRDYKPEQGLMFPHVLEIKVQGVEQSERVMIESVKLNPPLTDARFTKSI
jgi:hypothetical protein